MNWIRRAPVTAESVIVCLVIFVSCLVPSKFNHERFTHLQRECGAIQNLKMTEILDGIGRSSELDLQGPFDIWDGEWWRIPLTVIHHHDLLELIVYLGAAWYLGRGLENHWGSIATSLFLLPAACIPVVTELCQGQGMVGFSGVVCALLGALLAQRQSSPEIAREFPPAVVEVGAALMVVGDLANSANVIQLPSLGNLAGFAFGAVTGWVMRSKQNRQRLLVWLLLINLTLAPACYLSSRPIWLGRYHWYLANLRPNDPRRELHLERAIRLDPSLTGAWLSWSRLAESNGNLDTAWRRLMTGIHCNPSSSPLIEGAQRLWRHLDQRDRYQAKLVLQLTFGTSSDVWLKQIRGGRIATSAENYEEVSLEEGDSDPRQFALDQKVELQFLEPKLKEPKAHRPIIPVNENDAMEGESL